MHKFYYVLVFALAGCSLPEIEAVNFIVDEKMLYAELLKIGKYESVEIKSSSTAHASEVTKSLIIILTNPKVEVKEYADRYTNARKAVLLTINSIENHRNFDTYLVKFVKSTKKGAITSQNIENISFTMDDLRYL